MSSEAPEYDITHSDPTEYNVQTIAELEEQSLLERTLAEKISDLLVRVIGSIAFLLVHLLLFVSWFVVNLGVIPGVTVFDPFPFGILTLIVSTEGVFLAIFILISQNRMTRQAERRAHLDLQVNLLAEQELTMMLRLLERLCHHFDVEVETVKDEAQRWMQNTDVQRVVEKLEEKLPEE